MCGLFVDIKSRLSVADFEKAFKTIGHRGPDDHQILQVDQVRFGFHRLAIRGIESSGNQPFVSKQAKVVLVCNGEVYNDSQLKKEFCDYSYQSHSDCEVIIPAYKALGLMDCSKRLDAEYAFVLYDQVLGKVVASRDPIGIRPLFYGVKDGEVAYFASEAKPMQDFCDEIHPFPPGHYYDGKDFHLYRDISSTFKSYTTDFDKALKEIQEKLIEGVAKRLQSDVPVGYLLSGGLDSSLVCSIATKILKKPIKTFAVGINENPIDTKYAKIVAEHIQSDHTEVLFSFEEVLDVLDHLIYQLETYDITTIRASIGMYLLCLYIRKNSDVKVLMTGEVSDELFGYKYTDFAPSPIEFQNEAIKRVKELYMYDVLRADRCISSHGIEARVPFGDLDFVQAVMHIDPQLKMNTYDCGKYLLRMAFKGDFLPHEILFRDKAAFSDAVGHSMVDRLKIYAEKKYSDSEFFCSRAKFDHAKPLTKEALLYREIFESHFAHRSTMVKDFWMPNKSWKNCDVTDPSARVLPNYGASGH